MLRLFLGRSFFCNMNFKNHQIFSLVDENKPIDDITISCEINKEIKIFSLGKGTDISKESYPFLSLIYVLDGKGYLNDASIKKGDIILVKENEGVKKSTLDGIIYLECCMKENYNVTNKIKTGEIFQLKDLLPYQENKIMNLDVFHTEKSKLALISMAKGTSLDEHKAPGQALLFILDGEGIIRYEGKEYSVKAGDNFSFAKDGLHALYANTNFKFALLLEL